MPLGIDDLKSNTLFTQQQPNRSMLEENQTAPIIVRVHTRKSISTEP